MAERMRQQMMAHARVARPLGKGGSASVEGEISSDEMNIVPSNPKNRFASARAQSQFKPPLKPTKKDAMKPRHPSRKEVEDRRTRDLARSTKPIPTFDSKPSRSSTSKDTRPPSVDLASPRSSRSHPSLAKPSSVSLRSEPTKLRRETAGFPMDSDSIDNPPVEVSVKPFPLDEDDDPLYMPKHSDTKAIRSVKYSSKPARFPMDMEDVSEDRTEYSSSRVGPSAFPMDNDEGSQWKSYAPVRRAPMQSSSFTRHASSSSESPPPSSSGAQPFPMNTPKKRRSSSTGSERSPYKRNKGSDSLIQIPAGAIDHDIEDGDTSMEAVDPRSLCPFCDEKLPESPSDDLKNLLSNARRKAWSRPRYGNPLGLQAALGVYVAVCNLHRSESSVIPEGKRLGYPTDIDFDALPSRLRRLRRKLEKIVARPDGTHFFEIARTDIEEMGGLAMNSTRGQFAAFQQTQPGYYGERGFHRISQAINDLFPDLSSLDSYAPLDAGMFVIRVLVPEAARLLIKEDRKCDSSSALKILQESRQYGLAMFPDRGEEDGLDKLGVGMRMRLKVGQELMRAEKAEAQREVDEEKKQKMNARRRAKGKGKATGSRRSLATSSQSSSCVDISSDDGSSDGSPGSKPSFDFDDDKRTPRPRPKRKVQLSKTSASPSKQASKSWPSSNQELKSRPRRGSRLRSASVTSHTSSQSEATRIKNIPNHYSRETSPEL